MTEIGAGDSIGLKPGYDTHNVLAGQLLAAAHVISADGADHFMDLDLARTGLTDFDRAVTSEKAFVEALVHLCKTGRIRPFVSTTIITTLLRGYGRGKPRRGSDAWQVLAALADGVEITEFDLIRMVRRRNALVSFALAQGSD